MFSRLVPAAMFLTLRLKTSRQVGVVYDRLVSFQVWSVCVYGLLWSDIWILDHDKPADASRKDGNSIGKGGK